MALPKLIVVLGTTACGRAGWGWSGQALRAGRSSPPTPGRCTGAWIWAPADGEGRWRGAPPHAGRGGAQPALFGGRVPGRSLCRHRRHPVLGKHPLPGGGNRAVRPGGDRGLHLHRRPTSDPALRASWKERPQRSSTPLCREKTGVTSPTGRSSTASSLCARWKGPLRPVGEPPRHSTTACLG